MHCCGTGNRCFFDPWIRIRDKFFLYLISDLGFQIHRTFSESLVMFLDKKYQNFMSIDSNPFR
jgi:hypothetical protein